MISTKAVPHEARGEQLTTCYSGVIVLNGFYHVDQGCCTTAHIQQVSRNFDFERLDCLIDGVSLWVICLRRWFETLLSQYYFCGSV